MTTSGILFTFSSCGARMRLACTSFALMSAAALAVTAPPENTSHLLPPTELRCSNLVEPLAVAEAQPELSWQLTASSAELHAVSQSAYEIQVAVQSGAGGGQSVLKPVLWNSGVVHSAATFGVLYAGPALEAQRSYVWQVRVWDEQGHASGWSRIAHWTEAPTWQAHWIEAPSTGSAAEPMPIFRKSFALDKPVTRALLYASGMGQDELHINGQKVGKDELTPGWSEYRKTVYYDSYDVTSLLRNGENALGIMLGNGMYRVLLTPGRYTKFVGSYGPPKCIVQLHVEFADGEAMDVASDGTWKTTPGPITFSSTYGGEDFDARREPQGWDRPGFNDAQWQAAATVEGPGGALLPDLAPPMRAIRTYTPHAPTSPKPGVLVYDLGQNFAGWPEITVSGPAGAEVKLISGELLNKDGTVSQMSATGSSSDPQWYSYTLRGSGAEKWHPRFSYFGFRYVQVEGAGAAPAPGKAQMVALRGIAVHSSSAAAGIFSSSDDLLNRIHTLILRSIENNAASLFTDCPHREKLGWLEETHLLASAMLYDFDFAKLYAATARNIADAQTTGGPMVGNVPSTAPPFKMGRIPEIAPQYVLFQPQWGIFDDSPEWGSASVLAAWYVYQRDGDLSFLGTQYDVMRLYTAYLGTRANDGIIAYGLGDWCDIGPGECGVSKLTTSGVTATAIYYQDLRVMEKTAALLGKNDDSIAFGQQAELERNAFNTRFFDPVQHRYDTGSQTAQAMPLALGLAPENERGAVLDALVQDIRAHSNHVTAGDIGFHYVVDALLDSGRSDVLLDMLERTDPPGYGYQLTMGATALTEAWDADPRNSQDHFMLGHAEEWFYRGLGGINIDYSAQGNAILSLRPVVAGKIAWVHTRYESVLGPVESGWRRALAETAYDFTIPANAHATVEISTASPDAATVNGTPLAKAAGVISSHADGSQLQIVLGSGHYQVRAANAAGEHK
jgi:hypothetical protein